MFDGRHSLERLSFFVLAVACVQAQALQQRPPSAKGSSSGIPETTRKCGHVF